MNRVTTFIKEWAQVAGLFLLFVAVVVLCIFAFTAVLTFFAVIIAIAAGFWALGFPITVKQHGKRVGYVRWFTYYQLPERR